MRFRRLKRFAIGAAAFAATLAAATSGAENARSAFPTPVACAGSRPPTREGSRGPCLARKMST